MSEICKFIVKDTKSVGGGEGRESVCVCEWGGGGGGGGD